MSSTAPSRLRSLLNHLLPPSEPSPTAHNEQEHHQQPPPQGQPQQPPPPHLSQLSPTFFLQRAAAIEPLAEAVYHVTANGAVLRRSYRELADRARGLAYYLRKRGYRRVGILAPNTPAFLESVYGVVAAGAVLVPVNYRLKEVDVRYILEFAEVDCVVVDREFEGLLGGFREARKGVEVIVDLVGGFVVVFILFSLFYFFFSFALSESAEGDGWLTHYHRTLMLPRESYAGRLTRLCWRGWSTIGRPGVRGGRIWCRRRWPTRMI